MISEDRLKQLKCNISFWRSQLRDNQIVMGVITKVIVEDTVRCLEEYKNKLENGQ